MPPALFVFHRIALGMVGFFVIPLICSFFSSIFVKNVIVVLIELIWNL